VLRSTTIHLEITAQQGGGLLGVLLCGVANLLNNGGSLNQIIGEQTGGGRPRILCWLPSHLLLLLGASTERGET
jgi:hypothetical protein